MLIVIDATAAVSGGKVYLEHLIPQLARLSQEDRFVVFTSNDRDGLELTGADGRIEFRCAAFPAWANGNMAIAGLWKLFWRLFIFPIHLHRIRPDLLFSNAGFLPWALPSGMKTIVALHNSMPLRDELIGEERSPARRLRLRLLNRLMQRSLNRSDAAIVFSEDSRRRVKAAAKSLKHEPYLVYHGIDWGESERRKGVSEALLSSLGVNQPYLLFVSQFHRYKNINRLLEAFAILRRKHPDLSLVLVGEAADQGYWREVKSEIGRLRLAGSIIHLPQCMRDDLIGIYNGASAFVHPSLAETCSFPLLEALAVGRPVAAAHAAALPEMASDGALYFDPLDPVDMARSIDRLLVDEELREEMKSRALSRAAFFSWEQCASRTFDVMNDVAGRG